MALDGLNRLRLAAVYDSCRGLRDWHRRVITTLESTPEVEVVGLIELVRPPTMRWSERLLNFAFPEQAWVSPVSPEPVKCEPEELSALVESWELQVLLYLEVNQDGAHLPLDSIPVQGIWGFFTEQVPAGFWNVLDGSRWSTIRLASEAVVFDQEHFDTRDTYPENRDALLMAAAAWPAEACRHIVGGREGLFFAQHAPREPKIRIPSVVDVLKCLAQDLRTRLVRRLVTVPQRELSWGVGVAEMEPQAALQGRWPAQVHWLHPPPGRFFADPFAIDVDGRTFIFFEDYDGVKGTISCVEWGSGAPAGDIFPVLEHPWHLSYPYLFEHEGRIFAVPEESATGEISLYEVSRHDLSWEKRAVLLRDISAVDCSLFFFGSCWWMLASVDNQLHVFWSEALEQGWRPHVQNPITPKSARFRPAGRPFFWGGRLFRPAQNGRRTYGGSLLLLELTSLTTAEFRERCVCELLPEEDWPYPEGVHTLNWTRNQSLAVFDGKIFRAVAAPPPDIP